MRFFNLTPNVTYRESWFDNKLTYNFDPEEAQAVRIDTAKFGRVYEYGAGASLNTTVYGTCAVPKGSRVEAIRHVMRPSLGYSYRPNYNDQARFGFPNHSGRYRLAHKPAYLYQTLPRFNGNVPSGGMASGLSMRIDNQLQMKVRSRNDTTATTTSEKVSIIDNLGIGTFYNFRGRLFAPQPDQPEHEHPPAPGV
jgi:hypothetical protein